MSVVIPAGDALTSLLDRADESGSARRLLAGLSGAARDGMMKLYARLYKAGVEDGIDRAIELRGSVAPAPFEPPGLGFEPSGVPVRMPPPAGGVRSPVQAVVERYRSSELTLPSPPDIAVRLNRILDEPDFDITAVVELVQSEPSLAAQVLTLASSSAFSTSGRPPASLNDAVMRLGSRELTKYLLALCNRRLFEARSEWSTDALRDLWQHSLAAAILSEQLASEVDGLPPSMVFLHALLHDIGRSVLIQMFDEMAAEPDSDAYGPEEISRTIDGLHGQFGAALLQKWRFTESYSEVAMFHHTPQKSFSHQNLVAVVGLADVVACRLGFGSEAHGYVGELSEHPSARHLQLTAAQIEFASQQLQRSYESMVGAT